MLGSAFRLRTRPTTRRVPSRSRHTNGIGANSGADVFTHEPASDGLRGILRLALVDLSIELIGGLEERTPALHAVLPQYGRLTHAAAAAAQRVAPFFGPHGPIAATDPDADVLGEEVGQHALDLDSATTIAALFVKGGFGPQEMIVTPLEIGPGQVSDISVQAPTLGQHGFGAQADPRRIPLSILAANDPVVTRLQTSIPRISELNTTDRVRALAVIGPAYESTDFVVGAAQEIVTDVGRVICEPSI